VLFSCRGWEGSSLGRYREVGYGPVAVRLFFRSWEGSALGWSHEVGVGPVDVLVLLIFGGGSFVEVGVDGIPLVSPNWPWLKAVGSRWACCWESFTWCLGLGPLAFAVSFVCRVVAHIV
jgi:hypothetical protein